MKNRFIRQFIFFLFVNLSTQVSLASSTPQSTLENDKIRKLEERIAILEHKQRQEIKNKPIDPVLALPQANLREKYDTAPIYNQDLALLKMRKSYDNRLKLKKITPLPYPRIELGGSLIGLALTRRPPDVFPINGAKQSDINLAGANLNVNAEILDALTGNLRISYNPNSIERVTPRSVLTRVANSAIFLNTGFITLGNLNYFPFYMTVGQLFLPFGDYSSSLLVAPLTARLGRMRERPILIGFQQPGTFDGFNASVFAFRGDTTVGNRAGFINNAGVNFNYIFTHKLFRLNAGVSLISNIADSGGMQDSGPSTIVSNAGQYVDNEYLDEDDEEELELTYPIDVTTITTFRGFGAQPALLHKVPALDTRAKLDLLIIPITLYAELVQSNRSFAFENLSFNNYGAKPAAWNAEATLRFPLLDNPSSLTIGYSRSKEALAINMPLSILAGSFRIRVKKYLAFALGYQFETAYPFNSFATGQELPVNGNRFVGTTSALWTGQIIARF